MKNNCLASIVALSFLACAPKQTPSQPVQPQTIKPQPIVQQLPVLPTPDPLFEWVKTQEYETKVKDKTVYVFLDLRNYDVRFKDRGDSEKLVELYQGEVRKRLIFFDVRSTSIDSIRVVYEDGSARSAFIDYHVGVENPHIELCSWQHLEWHNRICDSRIRMNDSCDGYILQGVSVEEAKDLLVESKAIHDFLAETLGVDEWRQKLRGN